MCVCLFFNLTQPVLETGVSFILHWLHGLSRGGLAFEEWQVLSMSLREIEGVGKFKKQKLIFRTGFIGL